MYKKSEGREKKTDLQQPRQSAFDDARIGCGGSAGNCPMPAGWFTAVIPGAEGRDTRESRNGVMQSTLPRGSRREALCAIP